MYMKRYAPLIEDGDLTDDDILEIWEIFDREKMHNIIFHDGSMISYEKFYDFVTGLKIWFYVGYDDDNTPIGFAWIDSFSASKNTAAVHMCIFKESRKRKNDRSLGKMFLDFINESSGVENIIAFLPGKYKSQRRYIKELGFNKEFIVPGAMLLHRDNGKIQTDMYVYLKEYERS